jgi:hypothetical protein
MDFENMLIAGKVLAMEKAIKESTEDGLVYEDGWVRVTRENGKILMHGKPFRIPIQFSGASSGRG